jgi:hypothetical protein
MIKRVVRRIRGLSSMAMLRGSAVLTIVALGFMVWSMLDPTPLPVMLAMSVGQVFGTLAFALYLAVVIRDLRREQKAKRESASQIDPEAVAQALGDRKGPA